MNRRLAVAASVAASVAFVSGAVMLATLLSASPGRRGTPDLASAPSVETGTVTATSVEPVVVYQDEYDYVVTGGGAATRPSSAVPEQQGESLVPPTALAGAIAPVPVTTTAEVGPTPTTVAPAATTTTTRPVGVPSDWPAGTPIPPMPPDCRQPQLEDNGVWNCQH